MQQGKYVVGLGEALFDVFEDGEHLGGAPLNFAVQAHQLLTAAGSEVKGIVVSRVGDDARGHRVREQLESRGLATNALQTDVDHKTGIVNVTLEGREPTYDIVEGVAWDFLTWESALETTATEAAAVCFGSLAQRHEKSRETICRFVETVPATSVKMFDINLRQHYYSAEILENGFRLANCVKLNQAEIDKVAEMFSVPASVTAEQAAGIAKKFDLKAVAVTRGKDGTALWSEDQWQEGTPVAYETANAADSVGAGDACTAGLVFGMLQGWPVERILTLANHMGAFVASQPGATPALPDKIVELVRG